MTKNSISDIKKYGPEWVILELITKGDIQKEEEITEILKHNKIDWGELIEQAMRHKIFPMLSWYFLQNNNFQYLPPFINQYFKVVYDVNKTKTSILKQEAIKITKELKKHSIPFVCTKGIVLDDQLYGNQGYRFLSDIDFIVQLEYKQEVINILEKIQYMPGTVDWKNNTIRKLTREEKLIYLNSSDKLPELVKPINNPIIGYASLGFVTSFSWAKCPYKIDIYKAFDNIEWITINETDETIPALSPVYHFLYIILHLYKHAWIEYLQRWDNDVNLVKFGDVYRFWNKYKPILQSNLSETIKQYDLEDPVLWTLFHTDSIFGSSIVNELGLKKSIRKKYLNSAGDYKGTIRYWRGNMRERLKSKNRSELFIKAFDE